MKFDASQVVDPIEPEAQEAPEEMINQEPNVTHVDDYPTEKAPPIPKMVAPVYDSRLELIVELEKACQQAEIVVERRKKELKAAKETYDMAVFDLRQTCDALLNDENRPLLQINDEQAEEGEKPDDDAWKNDPIRLLELPKGIHDKLIEGGIETVGQLETLRIQIANGDATAQWPKGIGKAKITKIEEYLCDYWAERGSDTQVSTEEEQPEIFEGRNGHSIAVSDLTTEQDADPDPPAEEEEEAETISFLDL